MDWIGQESSGGWQPYRTPMQTGGYHQIPGNFHGQTLCRSPRKHDRYGDKGRKGYRLALFSWGSVLLAVIFIWGSLDTGRRTNSFDYETTVHYAAASIVLSVVAVGFLVAAIALATCAAFVCLNHLWDTRGMPGRVDKNKAVVGLLLSSPIVILFIYMVARIVQVTA
jgi:hypothetical protein